MRATGASALFNAEVPERLIQDVTGHKSNALHLYECPTEQQKKQVSAVVVQGEEFGKENVPAPTNAIQQKIRHGASMCNSFFSDFSNCIVNHFLLLRFYLRVLLAEVFLQRVGLQRGRGCVNIRDLCTLSPRNQDMKLNYRTSKFHS